MGNPNITIVNYEGMKVHPVEDCPRGFKTAGEVNKNFDANDTCMKCPNLTMMDGNMECKYASLIFEN